MARWIGADEASRRLGVKPATLYAYVSRGVLARRKGDDGRSVFDSEEIERLALRGRPRRRPGATSELVIESAVTLLGPDRAYYRGRDAIDLADDGHLRGRRHLAVDRRPRRAAPVASRPLSRRGLAEASASRRPGWIRSRWPPPARPRTGSRRACCRWNGSRSSPRRSPPPTRSA